MGKRDTLEEVAAILIDCSKASQEDPPPQKKTRMPACQFCDLR